MNKGLLSILLCGLVTLFPLQSQAVVIDDSVIFAADDKRYFDGIQFYENNKTEDINVIFEVDTNVNTAMRNIGGLYEKKYSIENLTKRHIHIHGNGLSIANYGKGGDSYGNKDGAAIYNGKDGRLTFCNHINMALKNIGCIENYSSLTFNSLLEIGQEQNDLSSSNGAIKNFGTLNINSEAHISAVKYLNGEIKNGIAIYNNGVLNINAIVSANAPNRIVYNDSVLSTVNINGDIIHKTGEAITKIKLGKSGRFNGRVLGSDNNFTLIIDKAIWTVDPMQENYIVDGVVLNNGGTIVLPGVKDSSTESYSNLTLRDFKSNGNFDEFNGFNIFTDVFNNKGGQVNFIGTTPAVTIPVHISDVASSNMLKNAESIVGNYEVVIATAPADSLMRLQIKEPYLNVEGGFCTAIIEEKLVGNKRLWRFLGWKFNKY